MQLAAIGHRVALGCAALCSAMVASLWIVARR